ncbi:hypothetical protein [Paraburkholderia sp. SIMBA_054]|uniref:hypothetical protein n=1 Tax=Paraburkholderia sp. SIMBA_054 TaxID=3085795 RepID=UPI0039792BE3
MESTRDKVITGTAQAEALLRQYGAHGRGFGEMVRDLMDRGVMPKGVGRRALSANSVRNRVVHESISPDDIELDQWATGIAALTKWVKQQSADGASEPSEPVTRRRFWQRNAPQKFATPPAQPARGLWMEPWVVTSAVVLVVGIGGTAWHFGEAFAQGAPAAAQTVTRSDSQSADAGNVPTAQAQKRLKKHSHISNSNAG